MHRQTLVEELRETVPGGPMVPEKNEPVNEAGWSTRFWIPSESSRRPSSSRRKSVVGSRRLRTSGRRSQAWAAALTSSFRSTSG